MKLFVWLHVSIWGFRNRVSQTQSVRTPREEITLASSIIHFLFNKCINCKIEFWLVFWLVRKCWNHYSFVNISPALVIGTWLERFSRVLQHGNPKNVLSFLKMLTLVFLLSCFVNNFYLILCPLMSLLSCAIHKHSCRSQHISVLTTCTFMFRQVCIIEPSFINATSGMHRRPIEGRHLVWIWNSIAQLTNGRAPINV